MHKAEKYLHITASIVTILTASIALVSWGLVIHDDPAIANSQSLGSWIKEVIFNISTSWRVVIAFTFQIFSSHYLCCFFSSKDVGNKAYLLMFGTLTTGFASFISLEILQLKEGDGWFLWALAMAFIVLVNVSSTKETENNTLEWVIGSLVVMMILYSVS
jgi:hypothetical protein